MLHRLRILKRALCLLPLLAAPAVAQEFWLLPPRFSVMPGDTLTVRVLVGDNFTGSRWTGKSTRLSRFVHYTPTDTTDLTARARQADTLTTKVKFRQAGVHLLAFSTTNAFAELEAPKFEEYLQTQGLERIIALRQQRGETARPGRELYRRCAKTLVQVGPASPDAPKTYALATGQPLEIIPEQNPATLRPDASLTCLILYNGRPLSAAQVLVWQQRGPGPPVLVSRLHSNKNGRVLFRLNGVGSYLVSTVYMELAPDPKAADWQSTWATLTFGKAGKKLK